jgi:hypothetical protein
MVFVDGLDLALLLPCSTFAVKTFWDARISEIEKGPYALLFLGI